MCFKYLFSLLWRNVLKCFIHGSIQNLLKPVFDDIVDSIRRFSSCKIKEKWKKLLPKHFSPQMLLWFDLGFYLKQEMDKFLLDTGQQMSYSLSAESINKYSSGLYKYMYHGWMINVVFLSKTHTSCFISCSILYCSTIHFSDVDVEEWPLRMLLGDILQVI